MVDPARNKIGKTLYCWNLLYRKNGEEPISYPNNYTIIKFQEGKEPRAV